MLGSDILDALYSLPKLVEGDAAVAVFVEVLEADFYFLLSQLRVYLAEQLLELAPAQLLVLIAIVGVVHLPDVVVLRLEAVSKFLQCDVCLDSNLLPCEGVFGIRTGSD